MKTAAGLPPPLRPRGVDDPHRREPRNTHTWGRGRAGPPPHNPRSTMIQSEHLLHRIGRRLLGRRLTGLGHAEHASETEVLHPEEVQEVLPAICHPASRERAVCSNGFNTLDQVWEQADRTRSRQGATLRLAFENVSLRGNTLWLPGRGCRTLSRGSEAPAVGRAVGRAGPCVLAESSLSSFYFGHWLRDDLVLRELAGRIPAAQVRMNAPAYPHAGFYDPLLPAPETLERPTRFERLSLLVDNGQNRGKFHRYRRVRGRIADRLSLDPAAPERAGPVLLARGSDGSDRSLVNQEEVEALIRRMNGVVVVPERETAEGVLRALWNAPVVVGVEGSQTAPWVYAAAPHAAVVLIQPPRRVGLLQKGVTECLGCPLGFVVGEPVGAGQAFRVSDAAELAGVVEEAIAQRGLARRMHERFHAAPTPVAPEGHPASPHA